MRKWILFALIGLVLLYALSFREGVNDTLTPPPSCSAPDLSVIDGLCKKPDVEPTPPKCPSGTTVGLGGTKCYGPDGMTPAQAAAAGLTYSNITQRYSKDVSPTCPSGYKLGGLGGCTYENPSRPTCASGFTYSPERGTCSATKVSYAESSGYADILKSVQDVNNGPLPSPINESADIDTGAARPTTGPVFASGGPFSGQSGTGRGSGASAAAGMTGNTYGSSGPQVSLSPFDFYPKSTPTTAPSPAPPGSSLRVKGPSWGGKGQSASSASASSSIANPFLYGPGSGNKSSSGSDGSGYQLNSGDTSMLPSLDSLGSNPENQYAVTSRVPGDQDLVPNPYMQSSSYSLANNSQKTDPVPFLANFSAFQR
jgi:hypothetical protein